MYQNTKFVQWYSSAEWNEVYNKIYSDDIQSMQDAYRKMCVWNARSPDLPAGVESTMELLQVMLCDKKCNNRSYSEKDLALMYSSAILRFLNHLKFMHRKSKENRVASLYDMAADYGLPDWIVNLRHEASHQCSLPSIHLLRSAQVIAFDWLKNNYWAQVADQMNDVIVADVKVFDNMETKVRTLLTLWQATQIHIMLRRYFIRDIPNENLRFHLEFALKTNDVCITNGSVELNELIQEYECGGTNNIKVTKARKVLEEIFKNLLPNERTNTENMERILVDSLIRSELFIPKDYDSRLFVNDDTLNSAFSSLWSKIVVAYHEADLTTDIINALVSFVNKATDSSQRLIASCWLSHICQSLLSAGQKCIAIARTKPGKIRKFLALNLLRKQHLNKNSIEFLFSNDLVPLMLSADHSLRNTILENTVNESVFNANPYSRIYLESLIDLLNPPLTNSAKEDLLKLINLYTNTSLQSTLSETTEIFTLESLKQITSNNGEEFSMEVDGGEFSEVPKDLHVSCTMVPWTKDHGISGWSKCALGCLPNSS